MATKKQAEAQHFDALVKGAQNDSPARGPAKAAGEKRIGFLDFILGIIDIINPLQHIPVVSTIYRKITGDEISPIARIAGDALYGGPIGAAVGVADVIAEQATGRDIGGNVMAMVTGDTSPPRTAPAMVAQNAPQKPDIIWSEPPSQAADLNARLAMLAVPQKPKSGNAQASPAKELADYTRSRPVPQQKGGASAPAGGAEAPVKPAAVSTPALQPQEAPAEASPKAAPPGLIAHQMMSGLDKYAAMKKAQWSPAYSAAF